MEELDGSLRNPYIFATVLVYGPVLFIAHINWVCCWAVALTSKLSRVLPLTVNMLGMRRWSMRLVPTELELTRVLIPRGERTAVGPIPDKRRSWVVPTVPAASMTSFLAVTTIGVSTARLLSYEL